MKFKLSKKIFLALVTAISLPFLGFMAGSEGRAQEAQEVAVVSQEEATQIDQLLQLLNQRLQLSEELADWKWHHTRPIDINEHDQEVRNHFLKEAKAQGIDPVYAERVIDAQIESGKILEIDHFQHRINTDAEVKAFDVNGYAEIEKKILDVDTQIAHQLKELAPTIQKMDSALLIKERAEEILAAADKNTGAKALSISPLVNP